MEQLILALKQAIDNQTKDLEPLLEALVKTQVKNGNDMETAINAVIVQLTKQKDLEPALEAMVVLQEKMLKEQKELSKKFEGTFKLEIPGVETITLKGEKHTDEEITALIKPLIPDPIPGKDADVDEVAQKAADMARPVKGKDYFTNEEVSSMKAEVLSKATPIKGRDYLTAAEVAQMEASILSQATPIKGIHYFTRQDIAEIASLVEVTPIDISSSEVRDLLQALPEGQRLNAQYIDGIDAIIKQKTEFIASFGGGVSETTVLSLIEQYGSGTVQTVTGLNTDSSDPANPIVRISVDGVTMTGAGTPEDPLVSIGGGGGTGFIGTPGSVPYAGGDGELTEDNSNFFFDESVKQLRVGPSSAIIDGDPNTPGAFIGTSETYVELYLQNLSTAQSATTDFVVANYADDGSVLNGSYGDFGITSPTYNGLDGEIFDGNDVYALSNIGNLVLVAASSGKSVKVVTGGNLAENLRAEFTDSVFNVYANLDVDILAHPFVGGDWVGTNGWSVSGGELVKVTNASIGTIQPDPALTINIGTTYKVTITASATSGAITYHLGGVPGSPITATTIVDYITALTTDNFVISGAISSTATITNITIEPIIEDTGDVVIEGNLTIGRTLRVTSGADVFNIDGTGVLTFLEIPKTVNLIPSLDEELVSKAYADQLFASGSIFKGNVRAATTTALPANTYDNGTSGVGATLTGNSNGALTDQDGVTLVDGDDLLVKDEADPSHNGVFTVAQGDGSNPYVLTRKTTYDDNTEIVANTFFTVLEGTVNQFRQWRMTSLGTLTIGTDDINFALLSAPVVYTASNGVQLVGQDFQIDLSDTLPGLEIADGGLRALVDGTTIVRGASGLEVGTIGNDNIGEIIDIDTGGTGLGAVGDPNTILGTNAAGDAYEHKTLVAGANVAIDYTGDQIEISSSVSGSADFFYTNESIIATPQTAQTWTNMPAALTEIFGAQWGRRKVNLTGAVQYRIVVNQAVAGFAGADLNLQYSTNNSTYQSIASDATGEVDIGTGTGVKVGAWCDIVAGAKQDVWVRLVGKEGDGVVDPSFRGLTIQFKYNSTIVDLSESDYVYSEVAMYASPSVALAFTNMPAAVTEFPGNAFARQKFDLSSMTEYRIVVNQSVAGFAGSDLNLQYSLNNSTFSAADSGGAGEIDVGTGTGVKTGAWTPLVGGALGDVWLRLVGKDGDGVVDPAFRQVKVQFRSRVYAAAAGNDTEVMFNDGGVMAGDAGFTYNKTTNIATIGGIELSDDTEDYRLYSDGGSVNIQGQTSALQSAFGMFSKDGDGTDNVYGVYFGKGLPGSIANSESLLVGYIASSTDFQIASSVSGTGTARPINIYTPNNYGQLKLNTDGSLGLIQAFNLEWIELTDDPPTVDVALLRPDTVGHDGYFAISGNSGDGTENCGFAVLANGLTPLADDSQVLIAAFGEGSPGAFTIASLGNGIEEALDLAIGLRDNPSSVSNLFVMKRSGDFNLNGGVFFSNSVTKKSAFGTDSPIDIDLTALAGIIARPVLTLNSAIANDLLNTILGIPLLIEGFEDDANTNIIGASFASGTKSSPTKAAGATEVLNILPFVYNGTDYIPNGGITFVTATDSDDGIIAKMSTNGGYIQIDENGDVTMSNNIKSINTVDYIFPSSDGEGYFFRASDGTVTFEGITLTSEEIDLTGQTASIGSTGFTSPETAAGMYRISFYLNTEVEDAGAGTVQLQFSWHDGTGSKSTTYYTVALNDDQNYSSGELTIYKGASQTVAYNTVVTTGLTSQYGLHIRLEKLN